MLAGIGDLLYGLSVYALQFLLRGRLGLGTYLYRIIYRDFLYSDPYTVFTGYFIILIIIS